MVAEGSLDDLDTKGEHEMDRRFFIAWLMMFVAWMDGRFVVHELMMQEEYEQI